MAHVWRILRPLALAGVLALLAASVAAGSSAAVSPAAFVPFVAGGRPAGECDPSYPTICLPSPPPDLNCPQIPHNDFVVLPPDPHRLDADEDGIGCESPRAPSGMTSTSSPSQ